MQWCDLNEPISLSSLRTLRAGLSVCAPGGIILFAVFFLQKREEQASKLFPSVALLRQACLSERKLYAEYPMGHMTSWSTTRFS